MLGRGQMHVDTQRLKKTKQKKTPTTVAFGLYKRWVSACVVPSGVAHLKGQFFIVHVQALGGATLRGWSKVI